MSALAEAGTTSTAEIADMLGVTRQTVYRYFPTTNDLLNAAAMYAVGELQENLVGHVAAASKGDPAEAVVEVVAYVYEHLRDDPALKRLVAPGQISTTIAALTAPSSIALGGKLLDRHRHRLVRRSVWPRTSSSSWSSTCCAPCSRSSWIPATRRVRARSSVPTFVAGSPRRCA